MHQKRLYRFWDFAATTPWFSALTLALVAVSMVLFGVPPERDTWGFTLIPPMLALLIAQVIALHKTPLWSWTEWGWVRFLGTISYPLYLYQQITLSPARYRTPGPLIFGLIVGIAGTIVMASISYYLIERPFLRLKHRYKKVDIG